MIRVLIVDDQEMIRVGLRAVLATFDDLEVVGEASDGYAALEAVRGLAPDIVLIDIRMPGIDGIETIRRLRALPAVGGVPVIVLTTFDTEQHVLDALGAGANGILNKTAGPHELAAAVRDVMAGGGALSGAAAATLIERTGRASTADVDEELHARFLSLTPRELEVVIEASRGRSNAEIAAAFFLSPATVKTHVARAMLKVGARDRAQLVHFIYRAGLAP